MYYIGEDGSEKRVVLYTTVEKQKAFDEFHVLCKSGEHLGMCLDHEYVSNSYFYITIKGHMWYISKGIFISNWYSRKYLIYIFMCIPISECTQTLLMLKQKYYWMSMSEDVVTMVSNVLDVTEMKLFDLISYILYTFM